MKKEKTVDKVLEEMLEEGIKENIKANEEIRGKKRDIDIEEIIKASWEFEKRKKSFGELSKRSTLSFGTPLAIKVAYEIAYDFARRKLKLNCDKSSLIIPYILALFVKAWEESSDTFRKYYTETYPEVVKLYEFAKKLIK
jgi:hypothetical protein